MSFDLPFWNLTDSEMLGFINEHNISPFAQYSCLVFQPHISSDDHDEIYNPDCQVDTLNENLTYHLLLYSQQKLVIINTSSGPNSFLILDFINIRNVSKYFLKHFKLTFACRSSIT